MAIAALLAACRQPQTPAPAPAPASSPAAKRTLTADEQLEENLMRAVFGTKYRPAKRAALATLPDPENRSEYGSYYVTAKGHKVLPSGDAVLVANAQLSEQDDDDTALQDIKEPFSAHIDPGLLNVFVLRFTSGDGWTVIRRHENVAQLGSNGHFGEVSWPMLARNKPGLAINHGWMGQGHLIEYLALYDLRDPELRELTPAENAIRSGNQGACDEPKTPCWSVEGQWRFAPAIDGSDYDDLVIDFSGTAPPEEEADAPDAAQNAAEPAAPPAREVKKVAETLRYAYDGERYKLTKGRNPVPGI